MGHPKIVERKFSFCPAFAGKELNTLIVQCPLCTRLVAACCSPRCIEIYNSEKRVCHDIQLIFTDGACSNNGRQHAAKAAGLGIAIGDDDYSWSIAVDDTLDTGPRTSQRAELLAAIEGLKKMKLLYQSCSDVDDEATHSKSAAIANEDYRATYIVVTDSEYVVKGITEWFPQWRSRGWRKSDGKPPANLDLFKKLDEYATILEKDRVAVGFWHVPRAFNYRADKLAKEATRV